MSKPALWEQFLQCNQPQSQDTFCSCVSVAEISQSCRVAEINVPLNGIQYLCSLRGDINNLTGTEAFANSFSESTQADTSNRVKTEPILLSSLENAGASSNCPCCIPVLRRGDEAEQDASHSDRLLIVSASLQTGRRFFHILCSLKGHMSPFGWITLH